MPWPPPMHIVSRASPPPRRSQLVQHRRQDADAGRADRVAERDAGAVDVEPVVDLVELHAPARQHREHLHREGLVDLDQVEVVEAEPGPREQLLDGRRPGRCPSSPARSPTAAQPSNQPIGSRPSSSSRSSATTRQAAAASFCWLALPAVTVPPGIDRAQLRPASRAWCPAGRPRPGRTTSGSPRRCGTSTGDDLVVEGARPPTRPPRAGGCARRTRRPASRPMP